MPYPGCRLGFVVFKVVSLRDFVLRVAINVTNPTFHGLLSFEQLLNLGIFAIIIIKIICEVEDGLDWIGLDWIGLDWIGLLLDVWIGLLLDVWIGLLLDVIGLDCS